MPRRCKTPGIKLVDSGTENVLPPRLEKNAASPPFAACSAALRVAPAPRDAAGARYNYLVSQLKLRQAAGNLTGNDLLPIDALLVK